MEKALLVVGASSDMGLATIKALENDYDLIIGHYRTMNEHLLAQAKKMGKKILLLQSDLSREDELNGLIEEIRQKDLSPVHIIHFPAPLCENQRFHKIKWEVFQREIDISLKSLIAISQAFLPGMVKRREGKIIALLSFVVNHVPPKHCANYVITKYAMLGAIKAMAAEYAEKGITVNGVSPAWVMTKYLSNQPDFLVQQNAANSPLGRNLTVEDVIPTIAFLLSDGGSCINGQNITISFGR